MLALIDNVCYNIGMTDPEATTGLTGKTTDSLSLKDAVRLEQERLDDKADDLSYLPPGALERYRQGGAAVPEVAGLVAVDSSISTVPPEAADTSTDVADEIPSSWKEVPNEDERAPRPAQPGAVTQILLKNARKAEKPDEAALAWSAFRSSVQRSIDRHGSEAFLPPEVLEAYFASESDIGHPGFGGEDIGGNPTYFVDPEGEVLPPHASGLGDDNPPIVPGSKDHDTATQFIDRVA